MTWCESDSKKSKVSHSAGRLFGPVIDSLLYYDFLKQKKPPVRINSKLSGLLTHMDT